MLERFLRRFKEPKPNPQEEIDRRFNELRSKIKLGGLTSDEATKEAFIDHDKLIQANIIIAEAKADLAWIEALHEKGIFGRRLLEMWNLKDEAKRKIKEQIKK